MNPDEISRDFPILKDVIDGDSASTSLVPEPVHASILEYYRICGANVGAEGRSSPETPPER